MKRILAGLLVIALFSTGCAEEITSSYPSCYSSVATLKAAGLNMAQEAEEEGIVLLKNVGPVLPLRQGTRVSLFGVTSIDPVYGGTGSGAVETDSAPDYVDYYEFTRYVVYQEGIYLGYRYTETRFEDTKNLRDGAGTFDYDSTAAFPFGYGLSYTTFDIPGQWTKNELTIPKHQKIKYNYQANVKETEAGKEYPAG